MSQQKLNIVRDCWWMMPSGDNYWTNGSGDFSSQSNRLYQSVIDIDDFGSAGEETSTYHAILGASFTNGTNSDIVDDTVSSSISGDVRRTSGPAFNYGYAYYDLNNTDLVQGNTYGVFVRGRDPDGTIGGKLGYHNSNVWENNIYDSGVVAGSAFSYDSNGTVDLPVGGTDYTFRDMDDITFGSNNRYLWISQKGGFSTRSYYWDTIVFSGVSTGEATPDVSTYLLHHGSGTALSPGAKAEPFVFRTEPNNYQPSKATICITAQPSGDYQMFSKCYVNNVTLGDVGPFDPNTRTATSGIFDLTSTQAKNIVKARTQDLYDYFAIIPYCSSGTINNSSLNNLKIHSIDVHYEYQETWDNHVATGDVSYFYPSTLGFRGGNVWQDKQDNTVNSSGVYLINMPPSGDNADDDYMILTTPPNRVGVWSDVGYLTNITMPSGGLSLYFNVTDIDPYKNLTRARLGLRMSLPPSGDNNCRDAFEIHGYNRRFKDGDYTEDMLNSDTSYNPNSKIEGYVLYGAGNIVEQSGFKNYTTELNFIDGELLNTASSGNLSTIDYRVSDIFNNLELQLVGLPSGIQLSAAELELYYKPNAFVPLYTISRGKIDTFDVQVDTSGASNITVGNGKWHHRGTLDEAEMWGAFYRADELGGTLLVPRTNDGTFTNASGEFQDLSNNSTIPTRYDYYRSPAPGDMTHYRRASNLYQKKIDFEDRLDVNEDFALYFLVGGSGTPTNWGGTVCRIWNGSTKELELYMYNGATGGKVACDIYYSDATSETLETTVNTSENEPIAIVLCGGYLNTLGYSNSTFGLYTHDRVDNYFSKDWSSDISIHTSPIKTRKTVAGSYFEIGGSPKAVYSDYDNLYLLEFAYASGWFPIDTNVSLDSIKRDYPVSPKADKKFFASRVIPTNYLTGSGVNWKVTSGSGDVDIYSEYPIDDWIEDEPRLLELHTGLTKRYTNYANDPSGIIVTINVDNHTDHENLTLSTDLRFNSGAYQGWKVWRSDFTIPSGENQTFSQGFTKHMRMEEGPVDTSDIDSLYLRLNTTADDIGSDYYADLTIKSVDVKFTGFVATSGETGYLQLVTSGIIPTATNNMDLYIQNSAASSGLSFFTHGHLLDSGNLNLYIAGGIENSNMPLYIKARDTITNTMTLWIGSAPQSGVIPLYIGGVATPQTSGTTPLYIWGTTNPAFKSDIPLYLYCGYDPRYSIPLFLKAEDNGTVTNTMNLFIDNDDKVFKKLPLYVHGMIADRNDNS